MVKLPEPGNNPVYPAGTYKVKILSWEFTEAKTGTKQIQWKAEIQEPQEYQGRHINVFTPLTEAAIWRVSNLIGATGIKFDPNSIDTDSQAFKTLCNQTMGRTTYWLNAEASYNGVPKNDIVKMEADQDQDEIEFSEKDDSPWPEEN